jgi:hypothetical protein
MKTQQIEIDQNGNISPNVEPENKIITEDIYSYIKLKNVVKIDTDFNKWILEINNTSTDINTCTESESYPILVINTKYHDAFVHWVFESGIYLPFFLILKKKYPNLKLYSKEFKKYKKLFYDFFQISSEDIIYELSPTSEYIFPLPISSLNIEELNETWKIQFDVFLAKLTSYSINSISSNLSPEKSISTIFLPRQKKENYKGNERFYQTTDICNHLQGNTDLILNTDIIINLKTQMELVSSSKNVVLIAGSAYFINGLFCRNSNIIVLDDFIIGQFAFLKLNYVHEIIKRNNKMVSILPNKNYRAFYYSDIESFLEPL